MRKKDLWERRDDEGPKAYEAFRGFLALPPHKRDFVPYYRQSKGRPQVADASGTWKDWYTRFRWVDRCRAYDEMIALKEVEAEQKEAAKRAEKWAKRREQIAETEWEMAEALRKKVREMLLAPTTEIIKKDTAFGEQGQVIEQTIILKPVKWNANTLYHYTEQISKLERRAADMVTERVEIGAGAGVSSAVPQFTDMKAAARAALEKARADFPDIDDERLIELTCATHNVKREELL